jgi:hypothetical protein
MAYAMNTGLSGLFEEGSYRDRLKKQGPAARALGSQGRGGDQIVAHLNLDEADKLEREGGSGTINPKTGLLEFAQVYDLEGGRGWIDDGTGPSGTAASQNDSVWQEPAISDTHGAIAPKASPRAAAPVQGGGNSEAWGQEGGGQLPAAAPPRTDTHSATAAGDAYRDYMSTEQSSSERDAAVLAAVKAGKGISGARDVLSGYNQSWDTTGAGLHQAAVREYGDSGANTPPTPQQQEAEVVSARNARPYETDTSGNITKWNTPAPNQSEARAAEWESAGRPEPAAAPSSNRAPGHVATTDPARPQTPQTFGGVRNLTDDQLRAIEQTRMTGGSTQTDPLSGMSWADRATFYNMFGYYPHARIDGGFYQIEGAPEGVRGGTDNTIIGSPDEPQNTAAIDYLAGLSDTDLKSLASALGVADPYSVGMMDALAGKVLNVPVYAGTGEGGQGSGYQGTYDYTFKPGYETGSITITGRTGGAAEVAIADLISGVANYPQIKAALDNGTNLPPGAKAISTHPADLFPEQFGQGTPGFGDEKFLFSDRLPDDYYTNQASPGYFRSATAGGNSQSVIDKTPTMITPVGAGYSVYRYNDGTMRSYDGEIRPITVNGQQVWYDVAYGLLRQVGTGYILDPKTLAPYGGYSTADLGRMFGSYGDSLGAFGGAAYAAPQKSLGTDEIHRGETEAQWAGGVGPGRAPNGGIVTPGPTTGGGNSTVPGGGGGTGTPSPPPTPQPTGGAGAPVYVPSIPAPRLRGNYSPGFGLNNLFI